MSAESLLARPFGTISELVRWHAAHRPGHAALVQDERRVTYGELDRRMGRVASGLQRQGIGGGERIAICAHNSIEYALLFLGALRAGVVPALIPPNLPADTIEAMAADSGARSLWRDDDLARLPDHGAAPAEPAIAPTHAFNIIYSSGTTGESQGHRAARLDALAAHAARHRQPGGPRDDHADRHAALLQHDAGRVLPGARARRHRRADGQVRCRRVPRARRAASRHPHDAGAGAVPAHPRGAGLRPSRPLVLPHQALDERAVRRGAQARGAGPLAGRARGVLRHDRGRRHLHPRRAPASRQAAHGRAGRDPAWSSSSSTRTAARCAKGEAGEVVGAFRRDDDRIPQPPRGDREGRVVRRRGQALTSAPATSAASTRTASSPSSTGART